MSLDPWLLERLVCPVTRTPLRYDEAAQELVSEAAGLAYPIRDGVPVIMNLSDMQDGDAKRMVDFSAGLVFGLRGSIERVTSKVFLLSPEFVQVDGDTSADEGSFYNQS